MNIVDVMVNRITVPSRRLVELSLVKRLVKISFPNEFRVTSRFVLGAEHNIAGIAQAHFNVSIQLFPITFGQVKDAA